MSFLLTSKFRAKILVFFVFYETKFKTSQAFEMPPHEVALFVCQVRTSLLIVQSSEAQKTTYVLTPRFVRSFELEKGHENEAALLVYFLH